MRSRRRILTLLLTLALLCTLSACGESGVSAPSPPPDPTPAPADDTTMDEPPYEDFGAPADSEEPEEPEDLPPEPSKGPEGLIIMTSKSQGSFSSELILTCLDPDTGAQRELAFFQIPASGMAAASDSYLHVLPNSYYATARDRFSSDYSKVAASRNIMSNNEWHAGWFEADGTYVDVTKLLGWQSKSDFEEPAQYLSVGFTEDDYFIFSTRPSGGAYPDYYYVPISNISPASVQEGNPFPHTEPYERRLTHQSYIGSLYAEYAVTDWIDDHTCLRNQEYDIFHPDSCVITDIQTREDRSFIPGESRYNWNAVLSPDGTQAAFMSQPHSGTAGTDLYVTSLSGGDPVKVPCDITLASRETCKKGYVVYTSSPYWSMLIDWQ